MRVVAVGGHDEARPLGADQLDDGAQLSGVAVVEPEVRQAERRAPHAERLGRRRRFARALGGRAARRAFAAREIAHADGVPVRGEQRGEAAARQFDVVGMRAEAQAVEAHARSSTACSCTPDSSRSACAVASATSSAAARAPRNETSSSPASRRSCSLSPGDR